MRIGISSGFLENCRNFEYICTNNPKLIQMSNSKNRYCVIMAGGVGSRFWPVSRTSLPKQFLDIAGSGRTFLQETFDRFSKIIPKENILVVTGRVYNDIVQQQLPELPLENILLEPYGRNTAPCIAYAVFRLLAKDPDSSMVVAPSDHWIREEDIFLRNIGLAFEQAESNDCLVTLGIVPDRPETNYGYIQVSASSHQKFRGGAMPVKTFTEKPDLEMATVFVNSGEFYWNSGIFVWKSRVIYEELAKYLPELVGQFEGWQNVMWGCDEPAFIERAYGDCPKISIDYGVMEKTSKAWLIPAQFGWSDLGTWEALYRCAPHKDRSGNYLRCGAALALDTRESLVMTSRKDKLVVVKGLDNYIVVDTDDVLLICPKDESSVKQVITETSLGDFTKYR